ncbi:hypothetical protein FHR32_007802 [Streptosporangium album]|uniref:Uncharacterized protein n=1 Tax=Streptosporangium album TaxID=47479 RepID=A0A7W7W983_9ACTN|nr:hypothetical protein [Streptosporangium album]MBB4943402.1 hypothetical protein [Streptosporangium album]
MTGHTERPLLFLDIDGPLLPFGEDPQRAPRVTTPDSHLARLPSEVGRRLAALPCDLVWATTWEDEANAEIAPPNRAATPASRELAGAIRRA